MTRVFHLGDVLSITTGKLLSPRRMIGVYDILSFMTGDSLFTHQIPRACEDCRPLILAEYPELADVDTSGVKSPATVKTWLAKQVARFGETRTITARPELVAHRDPISEAVDMVGKDRVIVLDPQSRR